MANDINKLLYGTKTRGHSLYGEKKSNKRQPTKSSQKSTIFDKQGGKCWRCHKQLKLGHTQYHHIKFVSEGGKTKRENLVALCANCHSEIHKEEKAKKADKGARKSRENNPFGDIFKRPKQQKYKYPF